MKKLFFSVALFTAMSASCFANGNNGTKNPSIANDNDKTAKVETVEVKEVKEEASSPEALHCKVYGPDGKLIYECWVCDCSKALKPQ